MIKKKTPLSRYVLVVAMLLFVSFSYYAYQIFYTDNIQVDKDDTYLYIPRGASFQTVLDSLEKNKVLHNTLAFAFVAKMLGYQENVKSGRYRLPKNSKNLEIVRKLKSGLQDPVKLTFNTVRLKSDLAQKIDGKLDFNSADFLKLLNDPVFVKQFGFDTSTIIAMFIPNTYQVFWNTSAEDFVKRMNKEYKRFWNKERLAKAQAAGFTPLEISIIASIVEAETNENSEKGKIAGVYINRLRSDMPLQADPTVKFALQDFAIKRVTQEHTATDSPYNTYKNAGLPPGPINMPSTVSIDAVLNYDKHKCLYFCASPSQIGFHDFAESYRDHVNNANRYRKYLDKQKIR